MLCYILFFFNCALLLRFESWGKSVVNLILTLFHLGLCTQKSMFVVLLKYES